MKPKTRHFSQAQWLRLYKDLTDPKATEINSKELPHPSNAHMVEVCNKHKIGAITYFCLLRILKRGISY